MAEKIIELIENNKFHKVFELINKNKQLIDQELNNNYIVHYLVYQNNNDYLKKYFKIADKHQITRSNKEGLNAAHIAAKLGYKSLLKLLLNKAPEFYQLIDHNHNTIFHLAVNSPNTMEYIIDHYKGDNRILNTVNNKNKTVFSLVINKSKKENDKYDKIINKLIKKVNLKSPDKNPSLCQACKENKLWITQKIIKQDPNVINSIDRSFLNSLNISIYGDNPKMAKYLLENRIDINYSGPEGDDNPLMVSLINKDYELARMLIKYKPSVNKKNKFLDTAVHFGVTNGVPSDITAYILYHGNINKQNIDGITPLQMLCKSSRWVSLTEFLKVKPMDIYLKNIKNENALTIVKDDKRSEFMDLVVDSYIHQANKIKSSKSKDILSRSELKKQIMINKKSFIDEDDNVKLSTIKLKPQYFGRYNSDTLHSLIYTISLLNKYEELGLPHKFYNKSETATVKNIKRRLSCLRGQSQTSIIDVKHLYDTYLFELTPHYIGWKNKNIYWIDPDLDYYILKPLNNNNVKLVLLKLTLVTSFGTHANMLIFDKRTGILERFEPYGKANVANLDDLDYFLTHNMKHVFKRYLDKHNLKFKYLSPKEMHCDIGFQVVSNENNIMVKKIGDPPGYCLAWVIWYVEMRVKNLDISPTDLILRMHKDIINKDKVLNKKDRPTAEKSYINFIRNYSGYLESMRLSFLKKIGFNEKQLFDQVPGELEDRILRKHLPKFFIESKYK